MDKRTLGRSGIEVSALGLVTAAWIEGIADALDRGWNAVTFDGPEQNAALVRQQLTFRPDWEKVITPVADYLVTRPDVDAGKLALLGASQGGYWVTRAAAFEHRVAAVVADPGVTDVSTTMFGQIPRFLAKLADEGEQEKFDKDMDLALRFSASTRSMMAFRMRPYGATSPYEFFTAARAYTLTDEVVGQISCPMLVTDPDREQFLPGQSQRLYDTLPGDKTLIRFTEEEGADSHCGRPPTASAASASSTGSTSTCPPERTATISQLRPPPRRGGAGCRHLSTERTGHRAAAENGSVQLLSGFSLLGFPFRVSLLHEGAGSFLRVFGRGHPQAVALREHLGLVDGKGQALADGQPRTAHGQRGVAVDGGGDLPRPLGERRPGNQLADQAEVVGALGGHALVLAHERHAHRHVERQHSGQPHLSRPETMPMLT